MPVWPEKLRPSTSGLLLSLAVAGVWMWFFGSVLLGDRALAYRDTAHFYTPLLKFVRHQWQAGRAPLWNPYAGIGVPLAAQGTATAFSPFALLLQLPGEFCRLIGLYVALHVLIAAAGAFQLARRWTQHPVASGVAALAYAFGGSVLFQQCNLVFLVGAAWMPWALAGADRLRSAATRPTAIAAVAVPLALMVLGGDPQAAYHTLLIASLGLCFRWSSPDAGNATHAAQPAAIRLATASAKISAAPAHAGGSRWPRRWIRLFAAAGLAGALAAVQILPTAQLARRSSRTLFDAPRSVYELATLWLTEDPANDQYDVCWYTGLLDLERPRGSHDAQRYWFSTGPWRWIEWFWPHVTGRPFPTNRRWLSRLGAENELWVPSLYIGLLPAVAALASLRFRRGPAAARWMSWTLALALVAATGTFGLGWWLRQLQVSASMLASALGWIEQPLAWHQTRSPVGDAVGGVYWLFGVLLPGYSSFRYPSKWLVPATLAASMLAAIGCDAAFTHGVARLRRLAVRFCLISLLASLAVLGIAPWFSAWMAGAEAHPLFGPLDVRGAYADLLSGLLHGAVVAAVLVWLLRLAERSLPKPATRTNRTADPGLPDTPFTGTADSHVGPHSAERHKNRHKPAAMSHRAFAVPPWLAPALLILSLIDLAWGNRWLVPTAPSALWRTAQPAVGPLRQPAVPSTHHSAKVHDDAGEIPPRAYRPTDRFPARWRHGSSRGRLGEIVAWQRATLFPNFHLDAPMTLVQSTGTLIPADFEAWLPVHRLAPAELRRRLALLGVRSILTVDPSQPGKLRPVELPHAMPRCWIVEQIESQPPLRTHLRSRWYQHVDALLHHDGAPRDLRRSAVVELAANQQVPDTMRRALAQHSFSTARTARHKQPPRIVRDDPLYLEIAASLDRPGLLVINDAYAPGWHASILSNDARRPNRAAAVLRTNGIMRGIWLPAGHHRVVLRYRPGGIVLGAAISAMAWLLLPGWVLISIRRRPRRAAP